MASPSTINFDGVNLLITLPLGQRNISVQEDIYSDWKVWAKEGDNLKYPPAFYSVGGDPLTPGIVAGAYYFLRNDLGWRIKPAEEDATTFLDGNLAPTDALQGLFVPTDGGYTHAILGLPPISQAVVPVLNIVENNAYSGAVYLDVDNGQAGTSYPLGTASYPVNNLNDAITIATARSFDRIYLSGSIALDRALPGFTIVGYGGTPSVNFNGQDINRMVFQRCYLAGTIAVTSPAATMVAEYCYVTSTVTNWRGLMVDSFFSGDIYVLEGDSYFFNCSSAVPGGSPGGVIDGSLATAQVRVTVRNYNGGIGWRNFGATQNAVITCGVNVGKINILSSCTAFSDFQARGIAEMNNESALEVGIDKVIDTEGLLEPQDGRTARKLMTNRMHTDPVAGTLTVYDDDDTTVFLQADLFEDIAATQPYRGRGADRRNRMA